MAKKRIKTELAAVFGQEPNFSKTKVKKGSYNLLLTDALQWYGQYGGAIDSNSLRDHHKQWLSDWALDNGFKDGDFTIPNQGISTLGALARIASKGFPINKKHVNYLKDTIKGWVPEPAPAPVDREALARQAKIRAQVKAEADLKPFLTKFDGELDAVLGGEKKWDIKTEGTLAGTQVSELTSLYKAQLEDINGALAGVDEDLVEAYPYKKPELKRMVRLLEEILEEIAEAGRRGTVLRKAKAVRSKKAKPASAHIKKLKFLPVHNEYNLASIDPEKLVGAQVIYVFDTAKRLLKRYEAGASGAEVSGTTLKNVRGLQKKIRKPEEQLVPFVTGTKPKAEKEFAAIKAKDNECTGRINENTILLKAF